VNYYAHSEVARKGKVAQVEIDHVSSNAFQSFPSLTHSLNNCGQSIYVEYLAKCVHNWYTNVPTKRGRNEFPHFVVYCNVQEWRDFDDVSSNTRVFTPFFKELMEFIGVPSHWTTEQFLREVFGKYVKLAWKLYWRSYRNTVATEYIEYSVATMLR
jgi:hypothetical protein